MLGLGDTPGSLLSLSLLPVRTLREDSHLRVRMELSPDTSHANPVVLDCEPPEF